MAQILYNVPKQSVGFSVKIFSAKSWNNISRRHESVVVFLFFQAFYKYISLYLVSSLFIYKSNKEPHNTNAIYSSLANTCPFKLKNS